MITAKALGIWEHLNALSASLFCRENRGRDVLIPEVLYLYIYIIYNIYNIYNIFNNANNIIMSIQYVVIVLNTCLIPNNI